MNCLRKSKGGFLYGKRRTNIVKIYRITQKKKICIFTIAIVTVLLILFFFQRWYTSREIAREPYYPSNTATIYLYGEYHGKQEYLDKEFELWKFHYEQNGMRDLFIETEYYTANMLNIWLHEPDDAILNVIYNNNEGTLIIQYESIVTLTK